MINDELAETALEESLTLKGGLLKSCLVTAVQVKLTNCLSELRPYFSQWGSVDLEVITYCFYC